MKLNLTRLTLLSASVILLQLAAKAQPNYIFKNAQLVSGTALQTGAKYKFSNVKAGMDAEVTITAQTGGITLANIDNLATGFEEAFQPTINIASHANGYVEFRIDFEDAVTGHPVVQDMIPVTCMNLDGVTYGDGVLNEQDQVQFFPGYYDYLIAGGKLEITIPADWVVIKNTSGLRYTGIDTTARDLMATVVNKNISGFLLRVGGVNSSSTNSTTSNRSVYFKSFSYGHMNTLPNRTMLSFSGAKKQSIVELKGTLSASHSYDKLLIERAVAPNVFGLIGKIDITGMGTSQFAFTFQDTRPENGVNYYRVRLVGTNTNIQEISNTLMVKMDHDQKETELINTIIQSGNPVLTISSPVDAIAELTVADLSGRVTFTINTKLNKGFNNINLSGFTAAKGYSIVMIRTNNNTVSQKVIIQ
jgi:hypothetical protein